MISLYCTFNVHMENDDGQAFSGSNYLKLMAKLMAKLVLY